MNVQVNGGSHARVLARRRITLDGLAGLRGVAVTTARNAGLNARRADDFALAVNEAATNTIKYANDTGHLTVGQDDQHRLYADISDRGPGLDPPSDIVCPAPDAASGRGLWLSHLMCDRVDVRSGDDGTVVRLEMNLDAAG